jgi:hypothetical protein
MRDSTGFWILGWVVISEGSLITGIGASRYGMNKEPSRTNQPMKWLARVFPRPIKSKTVDQSGMVFLERTM